MTVLKISPRMLPSTISRVGEGVIMAMHFLLENRVLRLTVVPLLCLTGLTLSFGQSKNQTKGAECRVEAVDYKGWRAEQISNRWIQLIVVPQNGGRLMQVTFDGHPYLFVNPKYAGRYLPPNPAEWFNYGGDKLWPFPEGNEH